MPTSYTYYVNPGAAADGWGAGNDANNGTAIATPKQTLLNIIDDADAVGHTSGDTVNIYVKAATTTAAATITFDNDPSAEHEGVKFVLQSSTPGTAWNFGNVAQILNFPATGVTSGYIKFVDCNISGGLTASVVVYDVAGMGMDVYFEDCAISLTAAAGRLIVGSTDRTGAGGSVYLDNTSVTTTTSHGVHITNGGLRDFVMTNGSSLTASTGASKFGILIQSGVVGKIIIVDSTITASGASDDGISATAGGTGCELLKIVNSTITANRNGIRWYDDIDEVIIIGSTITATNGEAGTAAIHIGEIDPTSVNNGCSRLVIEGNTIMHSNGQRGLWLGHGTTNCSVKFNTITANNHVCAIHTHGGIVAWNGIYGAITLGIWGDNLEVHHNSCYAPAGYNCAFSGISGGGVDAPAKNLQIHHNIFIAEDGLAFYDYDSSDARDSSTPMNDYQDYNIYYRVSNPTSGAVELGESGHEQICDSIAEVQTAWATATAAGTPWNVNYYDVNDQNSQIANPLCVDAANGDFRLLPGSPALNAGKETPGGGYTTIGAWQRKNRFIRW